MKSFLLLLLIPLFPTAKTVDQLAAFKADSLYTCIAQATGDRSKAVKAQECYAYLNAYFRDDSLMKKVTMLLRELSFPLKDKNDSMLAASVSFSIGNQYYIERNFNMSLAYLDKSGLLYEKLGEMGHVVETNGLIAAVHYQNNFLKSAISTLYKSLNLIYNKSDSALTSGIYFNLGLYLMYDNQPRQSIEAFQKSIRNKQDNPITYSYIAEDYLLLHQPDTAFIYLSKASSLDGSALIYHPPYYHRAKASYYAEINQKDSALLYYEKAIAGFRAALQLHHLPNCYYNYGKLQAELQNQKKAVEYFEKAIDSGIYYKKYKSVIKAAAGLAVIYEKKKDFATAYQAQKIVSAYLDSIKYNEAADLMAAQSMSEELERKEASIRQLRLQQKLESRNLKSRQNWITGTSLAAIAGISCISLVLYKSSKSKHRINQELSKALRDLQNAQQSLVQQEKLASLGSLTAGIAHEIKNPLNFVNNFALLSIDLIKEFMESADDRERSEIIEDIKGNLAIICEHSMRADTIVRNMLQHSHTRDKEKQTLNINRVCEEFIRLAFDGKKAENAAFKCDYQFIPDEQLPALTVNYQDISRLILNIVNNAIDEVAGRPDALVTIHTSKTESHACISIRDNGGGVSPDLRQKIFEPFFTTKPAGKGTGLGLSLSNEIAKAHGGRIELKESSSAGSEFCIWLPLHYEVKEI